MNKACFPVFSPYSLDSLSKKENWEISAATESLVAALGGWFILLRRELVWLGGTVPPGKTKT